jgi:hypothetical protein
VERSEGPRRNRSAAPAPWWSEDLYQVAEVQSVELQGLTWVAEAS